MKNESSEDIKPLSEDEMWSVSGGLIFLAPLIIKGGIHAYRAGRGVAKKVRNKLKETF